MVSTMMVLVFALLAAMFFFAADQVLSFGVEFILGIGRCTGEHGDKLA